MVKVDIRGDYDGRPLAVLGQLIRERQRVLGESARDAVVATGIDALVSLRALTKVAPKRIPKKDVRFGRSDPQYITSRKNGNVYRRVVVTRWKNGARRNVVKWQKVEGVARNRRATARELSEAHKRYGGIGHRKLAKWTFGVIMNKISTRPATDAPSRIATKQIAAAMGKATPRGGDSNFTLSLTNALDYAQMSLKHGPSDVNLALQKASNKIAGRLCKVAEKKFGERIATPFPEVKNRRAK